jgi:hypothetical protein
LSRSSRINKSTAVGALAACAVIGATSPVWADSGSSGSSDPGQAASEPDAAVISALRAEVVKLEAQLQADNAALRDATRSASQEAKALAAAKADVARLKAAVATATAPSANVKTVTVAVPAVNNNGADPRDDKGLAGRHDCHHHGDFGDRGDPRDHGDSGDNSHGDHAFNGGWRGRG